MREDKKNDLEKVIMKIHALSINLIIFGYDISKSVPSAPININHILGRLDHNDSIILNQD
jgi:hypothetical protein